ncbi:hypothetical protein SFR_5690 [Streptomyces sp. FR-008]|nr:hypothetical protein SFR_5690 [Streptomyces sp. FR-008]
MPQRQQLVTVGTGEVPSHSSGIPPAAARAA